MNASDIMTVGAVTVRPDATIAHAARLMLEHAVSGLPVVDAQGRPVGIVTESDLLHRKEIGTQHRRSRWLEEWVRAGEMARQYAREHGGKVEEVMTREVVVAEPTTPLSEIVERMEDHNIKRLPIVREGKVIGMVSRSNLLRALSAQMSDAPPYEPREDLAIRKRICDGMSGQSWAAGAMTDIQVHRGVVDFYGTVTSEYVRQALRVLAENTPGVVRLRSPSSRAARSNLARRLRPPSTNSRLACFDHPGFPPLPSSGRLNEDADARRSRTARLEAAGLPKLVCVPRGRDARADASPARPRNRKDREPATASPPSETSRSVAAPGLSRDASPVNLLQGRCCGSKCRFRCSDLLHEKPGVAVAVTIKSSLRLPQRKPGMPHGLRGFREPIVARRERRCEQPVPPPALDRAWSGVLLPVTAAKPAAEQCDNMVRHYPVGAHHELHNRLRKKLGE